MPLRIEQTLGGSAGGYLTKLEDAYALIAKIGAFFEKNPAKRKLAGKRSGASLADM